jgi:hemerythrin superfamily protein
MCLARPARRLVGMSIAARALETHTKGRRSAVEERDMARTSSGRTRGRGSRGGSRAGAARGARRASTGRGRGTRRASSSRGRGTRSASSGRARGASRSQGSRRGGRGRASATRASAGRSRSVRRSPREEFEGAGAAEARQGRSGSGAARAAAPRGGKDATALLKQDHQKVKKLFQDFDGAADEGRKRELFETIKNELEVHTRLEEEIFYRELEQLRDPTLQGMLKEAHQEHEEAKRTLSRGESAAREGSALDDVVESLRESVEHHIEEEEGEMFPRVKQVCDADRLRDMGARMEGRKKQLVETATRDLVEA